MSKETCKWEFDADEEYWATGCGNAYVFDGSPSEDYIIFCPYCGKTIEEKDL